MDTFMTIPLLLHSWIFFFVSRTNAVVSISVHESLLEDNI